MLCYFRFGQAKQHILPSLNKNGVAFDVRPLSVGDFVWIAQEKGGMYLNSLRGEARAAFESLKDMCACMRCIKDDNRLSENDEEDSEKLFFQFSNIESAVLPILPSTSVVNYTLSLL